jgi:3-oxoacyl-[acyl-carrier-protein] synthase-3
MLDPPRRTGRIAGLGAARPQRTISGSSLVERFGKTAEWLRVRTGITQVGRLGPGESLVDLAGTAARNALDDADLEPDDVDIIVVATCSAATTSRSPLSHQIAARVAPRAIAFDINAACAGFCYALSSANGFVETGVAETVLVVGAEQMSRLVDPADLGTSILFGDGAGAAVVTTSDQAQPGIAAPAWTSEGALAGLLEVPEGQTALRMQGSQVFRWAVEEVHTVAAAALAKAGVRAEDIDVFVPHQANLRIVEAISQRLGLHRATTATDVVHAGNTSAASIPLALDRLRRSGAAAPGQLALLAGFGAGLTIAAQVVRLP